MATRYCTLCERKVEAKRHIGVGTLILTLLTAGFWALAIFFYNERCYICKTDKVVSVDI